MNSFQISRFSWIFLAYVLCTVFANNVTPILVNQEDFHAISISCGYPEIPLREIRANEGTLSDIGKREDAMSDRALLCDPSIRQTKALRKRNSIKKEKWVTHEECHTTLFAIPGHGQQNASSMDSSSMNSIEVERKKNHSVNNPRADATVQSTFSQENDNASFEGLSLVASRRSTTLSTYEDENVLLMSALGNTRVSIVEYLPVVIGCILLPALLVFQLINWLKSSSGKQKPAVVASDIESDPSTTQLKTKPIATDGSASRKSLSSTLPQKANVIFLSPVFVWMETTIYCLMMLTAVTYLVLVFTETDRSGHLTRILFHTLFLATLFVFGLYAFFYLVAAISIGPSRASDHESNKRHSFNNNPKPYSSDSSLSSTPTSTDQTQNGSNSFLQTLTAPKIAVLCLCPIVGAFVFSLLFSSNVSHAVVADHRPANRLWLLPYLWSILQQQETRTATSLVYVLLGDAVATCVLHLMLLLYVDCYRMKMSSLDDVSPTEKSILLRQRYFMTVFAGYHLLFLFVVFLYTRESTLGVSLDFVNESIKYTFSSVSFFILIGYGIHACLLHCFHRTFTNKKGVVATQGNAGNPTTHASFPQEPSLKGHAHAAMKEKMARRRGSRAMGSSFVDSQSSDLDIPSDTATESKTAAKGKKATQAIKVTKSPVPPKAVPTEPSQADVNDYWTPRHSEAHMMIKEAQAFQSSWAAQQHILTTLIHTQMAPANRHNMNEAAFHNLVHCIASFTVDACRQTQKIQRVRQMGLHERTHPLFTDEFHVPWQTAVQAIEASVDAFTKVAIHALFHLAQTLTAGNIPSMPLDNSSEGRGDAHPIFSAVNVVVKETKEALRTHLRHASSSVDDDVLVEHDWLNMERSLRDCATIYARNVSYRQQLREHIAVPYARLLIDTSELVTVYRDIIRQHQQCPYAYQESMGAQVFPLIITMATTLAQLQSSLSAMQSLHPADSDDKEALHFQSIRSTLESQLRAIVTLMAAVMVRFAQREPITVHGTLDVAHVLTHRVIGYPRAPGLTPEQHSVLPALWRRIDMCVQEIVGEQQQMTRWAASLNDDQLHDMCRQHVHPPLPEALHRPLLALSSMAGSMLALTRLASHTPRELDPESRDPTLEEAIQTLGRATRETLDVVIEAIYGVTHNLETKSVVMHSEMQTRCIGVASRHLTMVAKTEMHRVSQWRTPEMAPMDGALALHLTHGVQRRSQSEETFEAARAASKVISLESVARQLGETLTTEHQMAMTVLQRALKQGLPVPDDESLASRWLTMVHQTLITVAETAVERLRRTRQETAQVLPDLLEVQRTCAVLRHWETQSLTNGERSERGLGGKWGCGTPLLGVLARDPVVIEVLHPLEQQIKEAVKSVEDVQLLLPRKAEDGNERARVLEKHSADASEKTAAMITQRIHRVVKEIFSVAKRLDPHVALGLLLAQLSEWRERKSPMLGPREQQKENTQVWTVRGLLFIAKQYDSDARLFSQSDHSVDDDGGGHHHPRVDKESVERMAWAWEDVARRSVLLAATECATHLIAWVEGDLARCSANRQRRQTQSLACMRLVEDIQDVWKAQREESKENSEDGCSARDERGHSVDQVAQRISSLLLQNPESRENEEAELLKGEQTWDQVWASLEAAFPDIHIEEILSVKEDADRVLVRRLKWLMLEVRHAETVYWAEQVYSETVFQRQLAGALEDFTVLNVTQMVRARRGMGDLQPQRELVTILQVATEMLQRVTDVYRVYQVSPMGDLMTVLKMIEQTLMESIEPAQGGDPPASE